jgi:biopolymer transport protein ExbD
MGMQVGDGGGLKSDMNVTPLIDVLLVLLVIFMVVAPMAQMGYEIKIPREAPQTEAPPPDAAKQIIVAVNTQNCNIVEPLNGADLPSTCTIFINKDAVPMADMAKRFKETFENRKSIDRILFLAAEEKLNYEAIVKILDIARKAVGEDLKVGIVTDEKIARMES